MKPNLLKVLKNFDLIDDIYYTDMPKSLQEEEVKLRKNVADKNYSDYFETLSNNHSIEAMDSEVNLFLNKVEKDGIILDIGGGWGWHWRFIQTKRPDITVIVVDFVAENFRHAKSIVTNLLNKNILLIHADATNLPFPDSIFSAVWTVQTFQHIPDFKKACLESHRVLKPGGIFKNYSLNDTPLVRLVYFLLRKKFHSKGFQKNNFLLNRANKEQEEILIQIFGIEGFKVSYSESFFHPDLKLKFTGRKNSLFGILDFYFSKFKMLSFLLGRQKSYEAVRKR